jgi:hypothetical protein
MSIEYNYEIISVNEQARNMEVVYTATGYPTMHIGARLPYQGETVESVIQMYAPIQYWEEISQPVVVPAVGTVGTVAVPTPTVPTQSDIFPDVINIAITDV